MVDYRYQNQYRCPKGIEGVPLLVAMVIAQAIIFHQIFVNVAVTGRGTEVQEATASWRSSFLVARGAGCDVQPRQGLCRGKASSQQLHLLPQMVVKGAAMKSCVARLRFLECHKHSSTGESCH